MSRLQVPGIPTPGGPRPTVSPVDTYYTPAAAPVAGPPIGTPALAQIAEALGRFDKSLNDFWFGPKREQQIRQAEQIAQDIAAHNKTMEDAAKAVKGHIIDRGDNPFLHDLVKVYVAKNAAMDLSIRATELELDQDLLNLPPEERGAAFGAKYAELEMEILDKIGGTDDMFLSGVFREASHPVRQRASANFAQAARRQSIENAKVALEENLTKELMSLVPQVAGGDSDEAMTHWYSQLQSSFRTNEQYALLSKAEQNEALIRSIQSSVASLEGEGRFDEAQSLIDAVQKLETSEGSKLTNIKGYAARLSALEQGLIIAEERAERRSKEDTSEQEKAIRDEVSNSIIDRIESGGDIDEYLEEARRDPRITEHIDVEEIYAIAERHKARYRRDQAHEIAEAQLVASRDLNDLIDELDAAASQQQRRNVLERLVVFPTEDLSPQDRVTLRAVVRNEFRPDAQRLSRMAENTADTLMTPIMQSMQTRVTGFDSASNETTRFIDTDASRSFRNKFRNGVLVEIDKILRDPQYRGEPIESLEPILEQRLQELAERLKPTAEETEEIQEQALNSEPVQNMLQAKVNQDIRSSRHPLGKATAEVLDAREALRKVRGRSNATPQERLEAEETLAKAEMKQGSQYRASSTRAITLATTRNLGTITAWRQNNGRLYHHHPGNSRDDLLKELEVLSKTQGSAGVFKTREAYLAARARAHTAKDKEGFRKVFDPLGGKIRYSMSPAAMNQEFEEFLKIKENPELLKEMKQLDLGGGRVKMVPVYNPNNIFLMFEQDFGLDLSSSETKDALQLKRAFAASFRPAQTE